MNNRFHIHIVIGLAIVLIACDSQSEPHSVQESLVDSATQNAIAGDSPHQAIAKATKGLAHKEVIEALGVAIEVSGGDAEVAAREYAEQTDPITGGIFVGLVQILLFVAGFLIFLWPALLLLRSFLALATKLRL